MDILIIGAGGREHALAQAIRKNKTVETIYALPGNGGIAEIATCVPIGTKELGKIVRFALEKQVGFAVVAPDDPLVLGLVDLLQEQGIPCFGPSKKAAIIEGSKVFSKNLMKRYHIPSALYEVFSDVTSALAYARECPLPAVVKADGLALGKGVVIANTKEELVHAIETMLVDKQFGASGDSIVIEEFLQGPEVSVLAFTDGNTLVPMISSMDHKRAYDQDKGPNTGGMGTIAPNPYYTEEMQRICMQDIFLPTIEAMKAELRPFKGCLYFGLMLTPSGPKVIEYNCRFGDPEAQVVLPLLESDLLTILMAVEKGELDSVEVKFSSASACCVVLASGGYPLSYETGKTIVSSPLGKDTYLFHAGTRREQDRLVSAGGRVLNVVSTANTLSEAIEKAYLGVKTIAFDGMHYRTDIGQSALKA
ncbi:phosphoribosylamine--glycine ligase [Sphaerochaeta pleomorpha str. Grapes]|uniref:Phosphoribosylamine--glycine ligase n=1 Tax=Sphaerochaeta pleomorpha (strain ATCC BAA-1885 / DSM 22778 / Grapes) TaxID=158190 RepID=G8QVA8_SPHPG|nr:phosphoribosylamine--glycine ligase [Sphaerochaeta pleomorpha]AEV30423.1 phosphoribosylamine--glycine ligase [Sphaerochaeta pleomorpha str. Grapes]